VPETDALVEGRKRAAASARRTWAWSRRHPRTSLAGLGLVAVALLYAGNAWIDARRSAADAAERLVLDGQLARQAGMAAEGRARAGEALAIDRRFPSARFLEAQARIDLGEGAAVVEAARAAIDRSGHDWVSHLILAHAATRGDGAPFDLDAADHLRAVEESAPESAEAYTLRSLAVTDAVEKRALLDRALEIDPADGRALIARVQLNREALKDFQSALLDSSRFLKARWRSPRGFRMRAETYRLLHDHGRALDAIQSAIDWTDEEGNPAQAAWNYWTRARINSDRGEHELAIFEYGRVLETFPQFASAMAALGREHTRRGEYDKAATEARRALKRCQAKPEFHAVLFEAIWRAGDRERLRSALDEAAARAESGDDRPARAEVHALVSAWHRRLGDRERALVHAEQAIELAPYGYAGYVQRVATLREVEGGAGIGEDCDRIDSLELADLDDDLTRASHLAESCLRPGRAIESYTRIIERAPHWAEPYVGRGWLHVEAGQYVHALEDFNHAIERARTWSEPFRGRAVVHRSEKRHDRALGDLAWAIELEPFATEAVLTRAAVHLDMARFEEAVEDTDQLLERRPGSLEGWWVRARALLRLGREPEALAAADRAIERRPDSGLALRRRALLLLFMGRADGALATAERAVVQAPRHAWSHLVRARALLSRGGGCARALADLATARALAPDDPVVAGEIAWRQLTSVHRQCPGSYDGATALDLSRRAVERRPGNDYVQLTHGMALYRHGRLEEAREALLRAVSLRAPRPEPWELFGLAMTESKLGHAVRAGRFYDQGVVRVEATYPRFGEYRRFQEEAARVLGRRP